MRRKLEDKLRLDGIKWDSHAQTQLAELASHAVWALKDQLGYKLPALLHARILATPSDDGVRMETLFGDDAEADAFVYSLYADILGGRVSEENLLRVCEKGRLYDDVMATILEHAKLVERAPAVERILIHLERQTPPDDFRIYGIRVVPFHKSAGAFIVHEDGRLLSDAVLRRH
jgi:hypothetical protein